MKQVFQRLCVCLAASIFLLSCSKTASLQQQDELTVSAKTHGTMLPLKGTYETTNERLSNPPMLLQRITGIGQSSHLGEGKFVALSTLNLTTAPPFSLSGTATFYAANGDEFYTSFAGTAMPRPDGIMDVVMNHTIQGGTGRFEDATGNFTGSAIGDPAKLNGSITYKGTISY